MELSTCDKYYDFVLKQWPELTRKQVDKIIKHGLSSLYMLNAYGGDVLLKTEDYTMYFGKLFGSSTLFWKYWRLKWKIKLRIKYRREKTKYDGYYYFGLTNEEYEKYGLKNKRRRHVTLEKVYLFKILDECCLHPSYDHVFRVKFAEDCGFTMYKQDWTVRNVEYILRRDKNNNLVPVSYEQTTSRKYVNKGSKQRH